MLSQNDSEYSPTAYHVNTYFLNFISIEDYHHVLRTRESSYLHNFPIPFVEGSVIAGVSHKIQITLKFKMNKLLIYREKT
jgi:hypothetical protein